MPLKHKRLTFLKSVVWTEHVGQETDTAPLTIRITGCVRFTPSRENGRWSVLVETIDGNIADEFDRRDADGGIGKGEFTVTLSSAPHNDGRQHVFVSDRFRYAGQMPAGDYKGVTVHILHFVQVDESGRGAYLPCVRSAAPEGIKLPHA